jgi:hypothetical protein
MAPTESSSNQSSSVPKSPKGDGKPEEAQPETAQKHSADPSVTKILQSTVSDSDQLSESRQQKRLFENQIRLRTSTYPCSPQLTVDFSLGRNRPTTKMELFSIDAWNSSRADCRDWPGGIGARVILYGGGRWGKELKAMINILSLFRLTKKRREVSYKYLVHVAFVLQSNPEILKA